MSRLDSLEYEFRKRYNRIVEIKQLDSPRLHSTRLEITSPKGTKFILTEYRKEGLTEYATLKHKEKEYRYNRYLDAEVSMADIMGEEDGNFK